MKSISLLQHVRFGLRKILRHCPRRRHVLVGPEAKKIGILFAGTYGDFVHLLPLLHEVSRLWPKANIRVWAPKRYMDAFAFTLPKRTWRGSYWHLFAALFFPIDLLFMNAVCVYRFRYELLSLQLGRATAGFRYAHEPFRPGLGWSIPLTSEVTSFAEVNYQLPRAVAAHYQPSKEHTPWQKPITRTALFPFLGSVLFSVGSTGFKNSVGFKAYCNLIDRICTEIGTAHVTFIAGPTDQDVVDYLLSTKTRPTIWRETIARLAEKVVSWEGCLLGFDSFMAHFALYLGRRMAVIHLNEVPYGYACAPFHRQIVLNPHENLSLAPFRAFLGEVRAVNIQTADINSTTLPPPPA